MARCNRKAGNSRCVIKIEKGICPLLEDEGLPSRRSQNGECEQAVARYNLLAATSLYFYAHLTGDVHDVDVAI